MNKKFWAATFTLSGTLIGAGILGLPFVISKTGFFAGVFWLIFLSSVLVYTKLCLGEISLRTKSDHQLTGYASRYLGKFGKALMFFAMLFGIYSALVAYLIGEGQSFSVLFSGGEAYSIYFGIGFWILMTLLLQKGLRGLKKVGSYGVISVAIIVLSMFFLYYPKISYENLIFFDGDFFFVPFGIVLFALLGFSSIPEMKRELKNDEKFMRKAIILGSLIPLLIYILFCFIFIGVLGKNISPVATLSFGRIISLLGIFTMFASYFVLSFSLKDMFSWDIRFSKSLNFAIVSLGPLAVYILVSVYNLFEFIEVLGMGGVITGGLTGILILFMNKSAKIKGNRKPEYSMPISWLAVVLLSLIFLAGIVYELFF